jgi:uncharacterized metal-binding protein YceD (DUF177 family)
MKPKSSDKAMPVQPNEGSNVGTSVTPPFSRMARVDQLPDGGLDLTFEAKPEECAALAALSGLVSVGKIVATFHLSQKPGRRVNVSGEVTGSVTQTCVISLEPFEADFNETIDVDFMPEEALAKWLEENEGAHVRGTLGDEDDDIPDPIVDGTIDLGGLASEFLVLALDPYPKKPGVQFGEMSQDADAKASPFAILQKLTKS